MVVINLNGKEFYLDGYLKEKLDNIKEIIKKNWDCCMVIDGEERGGKSTLGITSAYYLSEGTFTINNVAADSSEAKRKIEQLPDKSILLIDEGSLVFSSRDSAKTEVKELIKILNVVGQKNMIFIIVLPSFFELTKDIACRRSRFLLHVYTDEKLTRGRFAYFGLNKKRVLYELGKKNYGSYLHPSADFTGRFTDFNPLGDEYYILKRKSLFAALHSTKEVKLTQQVLKQCYIGILINKYKYCPTMLDKELANLLGLSPNTIKNYKHSELFKQFAKEIGVKAQGEN